jgi:hypothetical protein
MVQETRRITEHIETERAKLGENLDEFETRIRNAQTRIKEAASPKVWFDRKPAAVLGAAAATGLLFALLLPKKTSCS